MKVSRRCLLLSFFALIASFIACDTPYTIAWSYYYCAEDTLKAGDPYAANWFLKACNECNTMGDSILAFRTDSLMKVIEQTIKSQENKE